MKKLYKHKFDGKPNLIVIFQSMNANLYNPENKNKFELENTFSRLDIDHADLLFIKDDTRPRDSKVGGFYLHSESVNEICFDLSKLVRQYKKTLFTGLSAGGFASILFGSLCFVDVVAAINPQTTLYDFNDGSFVRDIIDIESAVDNSAYYDYKPYINDVTKYYISKRAITKDYDDCSIDDKLHHTKMIEHINDFGNVYIREDLNQTYSALKDILEINNFNM